MKAGGGKGMTDMLEARQVVYEAPSDGGKPLAILRGVDFEAAAGTFTGIVGPNGAGKTTLLRALAGFLPVKGRVLLDGRDIATLPPRKLARRIAYMHQDTAVPFDFTAAQVAAMGRSPFIGAFAVPSPADPRVIRAMERAGCAELAGRPVSRLSGGERQRVMLARALAQETPCLLLDEPTASLDIRHACQVFRLCREEAGRGALVAAVLHDLRQAARFCDRLVLMKEGRVLAAGAPGEVLTPAGLREAYGVRAAVFRNPAGEWDFLVED